MKGKWQDQHQALLSSSSSSSLFLASPHILDPATWRRAQICLLGVLSPGDLGFLLPAMLTGSGIVFCQCLISLVHCQELSELLVASPGTYAGRPWC